MCSLISLESTDSAVKVVGVRRSLIYPIYQIPLRNYIFEFDISSMSISIDVTFYGLSQDRRHGHGKSR